MEFWGVEVKAGQPLKVKPDVGKLIHISQAALGEAKKEKGNDIVPLRVTINGEKFIVGSLSGANFPQVTFDLVFEKEFELSHDWKNGSVYFCGYVADNPFSDDEDDFDSDEDSPLDITENGKIESKVEEVKPTVSKVKTAKPETSTKPKVTVVEPKKDEDDESDEDGSESEDDEDMMDTSDDISGSEDSDDMGEDGSEDEDEETPKEGDPSKKRPTQSPTKTPVPAKKSKLDTPQKTDGKKGGHTATPHPSKQAGKTPANSNKSKEQTPKSDGKVSCKSCPKTFNSETALQSHSKAKHAAK